MPTPDPTALAARKTETSVIASSLSLAPGADVSRTQPAKRTTKQNESSMTVSSRNR